MTEVGNVHDYSVLNKPPGTEREDTGDLSDGTWVLCSFLGPGCWDSLQGLTFSVPGWLGLGGGCNWSKSCESEGTRLHKKTSARMNGICPSPPTRLPSSPNLHRFAIHPSSPHAVPAIR
jgi:hypothetical protein